MPDVSLDIVGRNLSEKALRNLIKDINATSDAIKAAAIAQNKLNEETKKAKTFTQKYGDGLKTVGIAAGIVAAGSTLMARSFITAAIKMEKLNLSLKTVAGSAEEATRQLASLREIAKLPGLALPEAISASISLQAVSIDAEKAEEILMSFGNAIATVGRGREALAGVVLNLTQIAAKGRVMGDDLRQIANWLPQIRKGLLDAFGTASSEDLQKMGVTAEAFFDAMIGEFSKLPKMTDTAANSIENFQDNLLALRASLGNVLLPTFRKVLDTVSDTIEQMESLSDTTRGIIAWSTISVAGIAGITAALAGLAIILPKALVAVKVLGAGLMWLAANPISLVVIGLVAVAAGIAILIKRNRDARMSADNFAKSTNDLNESMKIAERIEELGDTIEELGSKTNKTAQDTQELIDAQNELAKLAPTLIATFDDEGNAIAKAREEITKFTKERKEANRIEAQTDHDKAIKEEERLAKAIKQNREDIKRFDKRIITSDAELREKRAGGGSFFTTEFGLEDVRDKNIEGRKKTRDDLKKNLAEQKRLAKQIQDFENTILKGVRPPSTAGLKPLGPPITTKQEKELIKDLAALRLAAMEEGFDKERAEVRAKFKEEIEQAEASIKLTKERSGQRNLLILKIAALEKAQKRELSNIDEKENKKRLEEAEKLSDRIGDLQEERIKSEIAGLKVISDLRKEVVQASLSSERQRISLVKDSHERELAMLNFEIRSRGIALQNEQKGIQELLKSSSVLGEQRELLEERLRQISGELLLLNLKGEQERAEIIAERIKEEEEKQKESDDRIFQSKIRIANILAKTIEDEGIRRTTIANIAFIAERIAIENRITDRRKAISEFSKLEGDHSTEIQQANNEIRQDEKELQDLRVGLIGEFKDIDDDLAEKRKKNVEKVTREELKLARERERAERFAFRLLTSNNRFRVSIMEDSKEKEIAGINATHAVAVANINKEMALELTTAKRKDELRDILADAEKNRIRAIATIRNKEVLAVAQTLSSQIAAIPFDLGRLFIAEMTIDDDIVDRLREVNAERLNQLREVRLDEEASVSAKAAAIERIERESADRRLQIEKDLDAKRRDLVEDYIVSFLGGILSSLEQQLQKALAERIFNFFKDLLASGASGGSAAPTGSGIIGSLTSLGVSVGTGNPIGIAASVLSLFSSFDLPANDRMAKQAGIQTALGSASFDNSLNDAMARLRGTKVASMQLGRRSAKDMVDNFVSGFTGSNGGIEGDGNSGLAEAIASLTNRLDNPPEFKFIIDGRELNSTLEPIRDKINNGRRVV